MIALPIAMYRLQPYTDFRRAREAIIVHWGALFALVGQAAGAGGTTKLSPHREEVTAASGGYTGLFRLPTTSTLPDGQIAIQYANAQLLRDSLRPYGADANVADFGLTLGFLPNLEIGLSFLSASPLNGIIEDRTVSAKLTLLREPSQSFSLAIGSTDLNGTGRREAEYAVAGKQIGRVHAYAGLANGIFEGAMYGASIPISPALRLAGESVGGHGVLGLKGDIGRRAAFSAAIDSDGKPFLVLGYAFPIASPGDVGQAEPRAAATDNELADRLADLTHSRAEVRRVSGTLYVRYQDVELRDPVLLLGHVLRQICASAGTECKRIVVVVQRFGADVVTVETAPDELRSFLQGFSEGQTFLSRASITDGGPGEDFTKGGLAEAGSTPIATVTLAPAIHYRLGIRDDLPNKEAVRVDGTLQLPSHFVGVLGAEVSLHDSLDSGPPFPSPSLGIYRPILLPNNIWAMGGLERAGQSPLLATVGASWNPVTSPLRLYGSLGEPLSRGHGRGDTRYLVGGGLELMRGGLLIGARHEKFELGDVGNTIFATRRYGETNVTLSGTRTANSQDRVDRVGVELQIPLPRLAYDVGPLRFASASDFDFAYRSGIRAANPLGLAGIQPRLFTTDRELTHRGELTAAYIRLNVNRLRK